MMCFRKEPNNVVCFKNQLFGYCLDPLLVSNSTRRKEWCSFLLLLKQTSWQLTTLLAAFFYSTNNKVQEEKKGETRVLFKDTKICFLFQNKGCLFQEPLFFSSACFKNRSSLLLLVSRTAQRRTRFVSKEDTNNGFLILETNNVVSC